MYSQDNLYMSVSGNKVLWTTFCHGINMVLVNKKQNKGAYAAYISLVLWKLWNTLLAEFYFELCNIHRARDKYDYI